MVLSNEQKRKHSRRRVHRGEGIKVALKDLSDNRVFFGETIDISSWGIGIVIVNQNSSLYYKKQEIVKIHFSVLEKKSFFTKAKVVDIQPMKIMDINYLRYSFEYVNDYLLNNIGKEEKKFFIIPDDYAPYAWCQDPFFFQETILFRLVGVSQNFLKLQTSPRNKTLIPNLPINLKVSIPVQGEFSFGALVSIAEVPTDDQITDKYTIIVEIKNTDNANNLFLQRIVEYILFSGVEVSPQELRQEKLPVTMIEKSLSFYFPILEDELEAVYSLRQNCAIEDGMFIHKMKDGSSCEVKDKFDVYSKHVVCKVGRKSIASVRIVFNDKYRSRCEILEKVKEFPEVLWTKKFVEISKLAWEKDYRESDVFINIMRQIIRIVVETDHSHILTLAPLGFKALYQKVGFQPLEVTLLDTSIKSLPMILDARSILLGETPLDKSVWNKIYSPIVNFLQSLSKVAS